MLGKKKTGIFQAKRGRKGGSDRSHRGLHCATHTDAEKIPRIAGTMVSEVRAPELGSGRPGSWKPQAWH